MKYTGSELRSIINHKEFVDFIKKYYYNKSVINVSLDYMPIFDQYQLFNNAKLVFAQHGASLFNIMFMKKDSKLVEIIDKNKNNIEDWFSFYSTLSNIKHYKYITDEAHTKIDINIFRKYLTDNKI
jgi:capsular polysaccharide biosynthesis protein